MAELSPSATAENEQLMSDLFGPSDLESAIVQAQTFRRAGDFDGATRTLSQLVLVAPDDPRVLGEYGKTLVAQGQTEDAIAFLSRAIELNPGEWSLYSAQGVAFDQAGNFGAANMAYQRALSLQPGEPSVLSNAGLSRMQAGDLANAEILLSQAIERGGANPRISRNLAMVRDLTAAQAAAQAEAQAAAEAESQTTAEADTVADASNQENATVALRGAVERREIPAPAAPRTSSEVQALAADPTVFMQTIPEPEAVPEETATPAVSAVSVRETDAETEEPQDERTASAPPRPLTERLAVDATPSDGLRRLVPAE
jgi:Flp pilus assembly protein TadD